MRIVLLLLFNLLFFGLRGQTTIAIESLPNTTPKQDTIFIAGSFNNWRVNDKNYRLHPQLDGKYSITLPFDTGKIEFKFTRGSWLKVESGNTNEYIPNRAFVCGKNQYCYVKVQNWQDLGGVKQLNYMIFLLFAIAFYGLFLLYFALRIQFRTKSFTPLFFLFNVLMILALIGGVIYNQANLIWQSHIGMIGIMFLFIWGPIFHLFLDSFDDNSNSEKIIFHFIPAITVFVIAILRFINFKVLGIYAIEFNANLNWGNCILIALGIFSSLIYHLINYKLLNIKPQKEKNLSKKKYFINIIYLISLGSLLLLIIIFIIKLLGIPVGDFNGFEPILVLLSTIMFVEFYYHWKYPEIFYWKEDLIELQGNYEDNNKDNYVFSSGKVVQKLPHQSLPEELTNELKNKLLIQMLEKKAFKDPKLSISTLSEIIDTKPHILSKLLNEQFSKNFRDFINEYRIKEFIELASSEKYKQYTLLALSYEVGFNSKSTFNLAFKKVTNLSPRDFLKNSKISIND